MKRALILPTLLAAAIASFGDVPPPLGAILDPANPTSFDVWTPYSVTFTATSAITELALQFTNDPGWTLLDAASVMDITHPSENLLTNPGFETGGLTSWSYDKIYRTIFGEFVQTGTGCEGFASAAPSGNGWCDGATQVYDGIDRKFATTMGDLYTIRFYQNVDEATESSPAKYQQSPNKAVDALVHIGTAILAVPEPSATILFGSSVLVLGLFVGLRRRIR